MKVNPRQPPDGANQINSVRFRERRTLTGADGAFIKDDRGNRYFDALSGLLCVNAGFGQPRLIEAAAKQMKGLLYRSDHFGWGSEAIQSLATELAQIAPGDLDRVFLTQSGSDAFELAIRLITYLNNARKRPDKKHVIALERSYHGGLGTAAGLTGIDMYHRGFDLPWPTQHHIPSPYPYRHPAGPDPATITAACVAAFHDKVQEIGPEDVAAFVCEPIQCGGGVIVPPTGFLAAMRAACDEHDILLIVDEMVTGFGRTGTMFACQAEEVVPDVMILANGLTSGYLPLGAAILSDRLHGMIEDAIAEDSPFGLGVLVSCHPVSAAVGLAAIEQYRNALVSNGQNIGQYFQSELAKLGDHPLVGDVRSRGMLAALELVMDKASKARLSNKQTEMRRLTDIGLECGLIFKLFSDGTIGLAPPLCTTRDEIHLMIGKLGETLDRFHAELRRS